MNPDNRPIEDVLAEIGKGVPEEAWEAFERRWMDEFILRFNKMAEYIHEWAKRKGFWDHDRNDAECIALMHSELSEALEALRHGNPQDDKIPEFSGLNAELADCIIRIMDYTAARELDVGAAIVAKMAYNEKRPYKHGKEF